MVAQARWCDRTLVENPYYVGLCLSEEAFQRELRRLRVPRSSWPVWVSANGDATTHFFENGSGRLMAIVSIRPRGDVTPIQVASLLVHEAVHVWQEARASMGEIHPSPEFEAYSIQGIAQNLMVAYTELIQC